MNWQTIRPKLVPIWSVLLGIITVVQFFGWWQPENKSTIFFSDVDRAVVLTPQNFRITVNTEGAQEITSENITETDVTIWRSGGEPITKEDVRNNLSISMPSGSRIIAYKVLETRKSEAERFTVSENENTIEIGWNIFDPESAIKISILRAGSRDDVLLDEYIGPSISVKSAYTIPKVSFLFVVVLFCLALTIFLFSVSWDAAVKVFDWTSGRARILAYPMRVGALLLPVIAIVTAAFLLPRGIGWLKDAVIGIPFLAA